MKLKQFSLWFSIVVMFALSANAIFLLMIQQAHESVVAEQEHRQHAMLLANELRQETEQLTHLVRAYTSTGQTRYLTYYYDILAIRQGEKSQPENYVPGAYWDMAIAGEIQHRFPQNGEQRSFSDRMKSLGFSKEEFNALDKVSAATEAMKQIEQIAFAATQGLYDPLIEDFVSDGKPHLDFASQLVHSQKYNQLKSNLAKSVIGLVSMVDERTNTAVTQAAKDLELWIFLTFGSMVFTFVMVLTASQVIRRRVLQPIERLSKAAGRLAQGDYSTRIGGGNREDASAVASRSSRQNSSSKRGVEELMALGATFDSMAESIEQDIKLRQKAQQELEAANQKAEDANIELTCLLDNSGQGFLSFGSDLVIDTQYSLACETMLGRSPSGRNAADVFFHDDAAKSDLFCMIISSVPVESDPCIRESMLSLLPTEIQRDDVLLKAEYKILENGKFMVVLTDITEERLLEAMLQSERRHLELIVMAVSDSRNFFDSIDTFREFLTYGLPRMLNGTAAPQILAKGLYREIHTYKGLLNQFSFPNTPKVLHNIETRLSGLLSLGDALTRQKIAELVLPDALQASFDKDLAVLSDALGEEFLAHGESIILTGDQALQLEKLAIRLLRGEIVDASVAEIRTLLNEMGTLRKVPFKDVLMGFDGLVRQAAERMEKKVAPIEVKGGADVWIDPHAYRPFLRSLGHVFRNSVAHGIESPDVRCEAEKDEAGKITCSVALEGSAIKLTIADDGSGIDLDALRQRAVAAGICNATEAADVADDEVAKLIFMDNISTQQEVTELAGRGVGLAAVLNETKNMGGEVVVKTVAGQGTQFLFTLPLQQNVPSEKV